MTFKALLLTAIMVAPLAAPVAAQALRPDQEAFKALYKQLVETNTTLSAGSCTLAAQQLATRLKAAGFKDSDITLFADPAHPKEGGIVAVLHGSDTKAKPILLLGHLDVVEAKRADWTRDPFVMVEENGYYYGRGTFDDKAQAAVWTDTLIRYKQAGKTPKRTLKLALTCGEETTNAFNGADWLAKHRPELIAAEFALNEGGGGRYDDAGKPMGLAVQVGEKTVQNYKLETTNPGGHSSVPRPDNAITDLARAIVAVDTHEFPVQFNDTTRAFFGVMAKATPPVVGNAITALRATANVNCRMFPGSDPKAIQADLAKAVDNGKVAITLTPPVRPMAVSPPLNPAVLGPMKALAEKRFPGVPFGLTMSTGATDAIFLSPIGIPTYGVPGMFIDPDGNGIHGLNERIRISSLMEGRDYLDELVHKLAD